MSVERKTITEKLQAATDAEQMATRALRASVEQGSNPESIKDLLSVTADRHREKLAILDQLNPANLK